MMKKWIAMLLAFVMILPAAALGTAESEAPTVDELIAFCDTLLSEALREAPVAAEEAEEGGYRFDYGNFAIYSPDDTLRENSRITGVEISGSEELIADMRGIACGSALETLLAAYPLDNASLSGTYEEAALYIRGSLPGEAGSGRAVRSGSHVLVAEYDVYNSEGLQAEKCCVLYTLENNEVIAIQVLLGVQVMSLEEAQAELDTLAALQEKNEYSAYFSDAPEMLAREDLYFSGIDFLTASPQALTSAFGNAQSDTWEADQDGFLRIMQWESMQAIFEYDGKKQDGSLRLLEIFGSQIEGPRGLHMGDAVQNVLARFPQQESAMLYGDGVNAPYGRYEETASGAQAAYAVEVEGKTVLLTLLMLDGRLVDITVSYQ